MSVRNLNESDQPDLRVQVYYVHGAARANNTRRYDIGFAMEDPNIRVPAFTPVAKSDPYPIYAERRASAPVHPLPMPDGWSAVAGHPV